MDRFKEEQNSSNKSKALSAFHDLKLPGDEPLTNEKDQDCSYNLCEALMRRTATTPTTKPPLFARPVIPEGDYDRSETIAAEGNIFNNSSCDLWQKNAEFVPNSSATARLCLEGCPEKAEKMRLETEDRYDED